MVLPLEYIVPQLAGHWNLGFGCFAQGDADRIAQAIGQQGTDAQRTLDASIFTITSLCHAQVKREVHPLTLHDLSQQTDSTYHHYGVRGFDGDDHIHELLLHADTQKLHARLHHPLRGIAIA